VKKKQFCRKSDKQNSAVNNSTKSIHHTWYTVARENIIVLILLHTIYDTVQRMMN